MASESLINELFEIVQTNSEEKLSYDDFEKDLLKNINLPNDEIDRALSIILSQAEVNPNIVGETKGGKFLISPSFSSAIVSTIKYENQFIPGKPEFLVREQNQTINQDIVANIIFTPIVISQMIDNFENLTEKEVVELSGQFYKMSDEEKNKYKIAQKKRIEDEKNKVEKKESKEAFDDLEKMVDTNNSMHDKMQSGKLPDSIKKLYRTEMLASEEFKKFYYEKLGKNLPDETELTDEDYEIWLSYSYKTINEISTVVSFYDRAIKAMEKNDLKQLIELCVEHPEIAERFMKEIERIAQESGIELSEIFGEKIFQYVDQSIKQTDVHLDVDDKSLNKESAGETFVRNGEKTYSGFVDFFSQLLELPEETRGEILSNQQMSNFVGGNAWDYIRTNIQLDNMYTAEQVQHTAAILKIYDVEKRLSEKDIIINKTTEDKFSYDMASYEMASEDLGSYFDDEDFEDVPKAEGERESISIDIAKESTEEIEKIMSENTKDGFFRRITQTEIEPYYERNAETIVVATENKKSIDKKTSETGTPLDFDDITKKVKAQMVAGKIVGILSKISNVRSEQIIEEQQGVTSLISNELSKGNKTNEEQARSEDEEPEQ